MPKKKIEATADHPAGVEATAEELRLNETSAPAPAVLSGDVETIDIFQGEQFVRQYSRSVHGDNFAELADSYIAGHPHCHKQ